MYVPVDSQEEYMQFTIPMIAIINKYKEFTGYR